MNLTERNRIPFTTDTFQTEMNEWIRLASNNVRRRHSRNMLGQIKYTRKDVRPVLPLEDYCYYTGIQFADVENEHTNPNDPRKRTLDHKIPLSICYMRGMSMDESNHPDNLVWCLRVINNIRGCSDTNSFLPVAQYYREKFIECGYAHSPSPLV